ncbi:hypothetical protein C1A38_15705 [Verrucosispora sp. ts21]|nr:hypothetical protein C1A38_15705 [Verrucosispora sp. ts21]
MLPVTAPGREKHWRPAPRRSAPAGSNPAGGGHDRRRDGIGRAISASSRANPGIEPGCGLFIRAWGNTTGVDEPIGPRTRVWQ